MPFVPFFDVCCRGLEGANFPSFVWFGTGLDQVRSDQVRSGQARSAWKSTRGPAQSQMGSEGGLCGSEAWIRDLQCSSSTVEVARLPGNLWRLLAALDRTRPSNTLSGWSSRLRTCKPSLSVVDLALTRLSAQEAGLSSKFPQFQTRSALTDDWDGENGLWGWPGMRLAAGINKVKSFSNVSSSAGGRSRGDEKTQSLICKIWKPNLGVHAWLFVAEVWVWY